MADSPLDSTAFSVAKDRLSELMTAVVHEHAPHLVSRRNGKEQMVLVRADDLAKVLAPFRFEPQVTMDSGEVTVELPPLDVLGFGETLEEAMDDLLAELRTYARDFFATASLYMQTDRADHAPWLLRLALTPEERQLDLLYEAEARAKAERPSRAAA